MLYDFYSNSIHESDFHSGITLECLFEHIKKLQTHTTFPTNVGSIVGHHVSVVVEPVLKIILVFLVAKKPLKKKNPQYLIFVCTKLRTVKQIRRIRSSHVPPLWNS